MQLDQLNWVVTQLKKLGYSEGEVKWFLSHKTIEALSEWITQLLNSEK